MSSKVVEANAGFHSLAMAVAVCSSPPWLSQWFPDARVAPSLSRVGDCTVSVCHPNRGMVIVPVKPILILLVFPLVWCLGVQTPSTLNATWTSPTSTLADM